MAKRLLETMSLAELANWDGSDEMAIVGQRAEARKAGDWAESDRLREELSNNGFVVTDRKDGSTEPSRLADRLFGPSGMGVKNFKVDAVMGATPERIARTVNEALDALERGDYEEVDLEKDDDQHFYEVFANVRGTISPDVDLG